MVEKSLYWIFDPKEQKGNENQLAFVYFREDAIAAN
jgi:hypothetical protein